jgi:hypothetical protein
MADTGKPLFLLLAELGVKDGVAPIHNLPGCWERQIGPHWWVAVNGHKQPMLCSKSEIPVAPFHCYVMFNGWPAGLFDPYGGTIAAGEAANEETFAAAIEAEIANG